MKNVLQFEKVKKLDNEHVECLVKTEDGGTKKLVRMFRKHTKEIRALQRHGIYCFEIQGILYWYCVLAESDLYFDDVELTEYKEPEDFRSASRKTNVLIGKKEHNSVVVETPKAKPMPKTKEEPKPESKEVRHKKFETIKTCIENNIPVYLAGPAGSGKNYTLEQISWELGMEFYFTNSVQQEYKLTGFIDAGGTYHETEFYKAFTKGGIFFLDEMDSSIPEVLVLLNAAIANKYFEFPTGRVQAHKNFRVVAAGNTVGSGADELYTGRMVLDQATLDRFAIIEFGYDEAIELHLAKGNKELVCFIHSLRAQAEQNGIRATFSYRCISMVTKLERAGMERKEVLQIAVFKGMGIDTIQSFTGHGNLYFESLRTLQRAA